MEDNHRQSVDKATSQAGKSTVRNTDTNASSTFSFQPEVMQPDDKMGSPQIQALEDVLANPKAMTSKDTGFRDITDSEQPLIPSHMIGRGRGYASTPEGQYGEDRPQHREVLDSELAVAVAINEDDEDAEKEYLVAVHAVEYDPDSKPPIYLNRRFRLYTICACIAFLVVLVVVIVVSVTTNSDETAVTIYLTNSPTVAPTQEPTNARESLYLTYFAEELGLKEIAPGSAEALAADWIMYDDPAALEIDSPRLLQRFVLTFLYFHTTELGEGEWRSCNPPKDDEDDRCQFLELDRQPNGTEAFIPIDGRIRWLSAAQECEWSGVTCANDQVARIRLVSQQLTGPLPTQLRALPFLQILQFHYNEMTGTIPPEYAAFRHLLSLEVHGNLLTGKVPEAFFEQDVTELITLNVGDNLLTGTIDTRIGQLTDLKGLFLFKNYFIGPLPTELGNLPYLTYSRIYGNQISGQLPTEIGRLSQLVEFWYNDCRLTGVIPTEYGQLQRMQDFRVSGNMLTGSIPPELFSMTKIQLMVLGDNALTGPLPSTELLQMTDLQQLRVSSNQLTGPIPTELGAMPLLRLAHLHLNLFTGEVPLSVCAANIPDGLNFLQVDCAPAEDPPNPCRCCSSCCDRATEVCLTVE
jgi:hypothetical protein